MAPDPPSDSGGTLSAMDRAFLTGVPDAGELLLVRHGKQDFPAPGTRDISLWMDPPLSKVGQRQAEAVGDYLARRPVAAVYSSRLLRAAATGRAIAERHGLTVGADDRLREVEIFRDLPPGSTSAVETFGADEMKAAQERFVATRRWNAYPASESGPELRARVVDAVEAIVASHPGQTVVVACHGGVINAYLVHILGVAEDMFFRPAHASVHRVRFADTRRVVTTLNEITHLEDADLLTW